MCAGPDPYPLTIYAAAAVQELYAKMKVKDAKIAHGRQEIAELRAPLDRLEALILANAGAAAADAR